MAPSLWFGVSSRLSDAYIDPHIVVVGCARTRVDHKSCRETFSLAVLQSPKPPRPIQRPNVANLLGRDCSPSCCLDLTLPIFVVTGVYSVVSIAKVSCIGKYCYVVPSEDELDFGDQTIVAVGGGAGGDARGGCPRKDFTLRNQSVVPAAFTVRPRLKEGGGNSPWWYHCGVHVQFRTI